jgi:hypothetical protein
MANVLITPSIIAKEALAQLENNLVFGNLVHREYVNEFKKIGDTVSIRRPVKFYTSDGATRVNQDVEEANSQVVINSRKHVSWSFTTQDLTLTIEQYSERYIKPAMITLAQTVDKSVAGLYTTFWNHVGAPATTPSTLANSAALVAQRMDEMAVPPDGRRRLVLDPASRYAITGSASALNVDAIAETAYRNAVVGNMASLATYATANVPTHTVGVATGTPLINGAAQNVTYANANKLTWSQSLITDGWTNSTTGILLAGDVITIAGVNAVNPVPGEGATGKTVMPYLQEFTVLADADSGATTGPATLTISPPIIVSGPNQTVDAAPADGAAIVVKTGTGGTTYPQNMGFHRNAMALVTVPLEMPDSVPMSGKGRHTHNGLSMRAVKQYDIGPDTEAIRLDILYGVKAIYPDLGVRLTG